MLYNVGNFDDHLNLVSISTMSTLTTPSGLKPGSSISAMKRMYGKQVDEATDEEFTLYKYTMNNYNLVFYSFKNKIYYWQIYTPCKFELLDKNFPDEKCNL